MKRRLLYTSLTALFLMVALVGVLPQPKASAATSESDIASATDFSWVNRYTIKGVIGNQTYTFYNKDANGAVGSTAYKIQNYGCFGSAIVDVPGVGSDYGNPLSKAPNTLKLDMDFKDPAAAGNVPCQNTSPNSISKTLSNPDGRAFSYFFTLSSDGGTIKSADNDNNWSFTQSSKYPNLYTRDSEKGKSCQDIIQVMQRSGYAQYRLYELTADNTGIPVPSGPDDSSDPGIHADGCYQAKSGDRVSPVGTDGKWFPLDDTLYKANSSAAAGTVQVTTPSSTGGASDATPTLDCKAGINPLNWLLCGMVKGMVGIIGGLDTLINNFLSTGTPGNGSDPCQVFGPSSTSGQYSTDNITQSGCSGNMGGAVPSSYYQAWSNMRNIALGLMVVAGLAVIIAQAIGAEVMDAYTIRKVLPRILLVAIGISLSWQIMQFMVKFTNELGYGVRNIIYSPFSGLNNTINAGGGAGLGVDIIGAGAIGALGIFGLLSFAATGALAVFLAILILILRQIAIIVLIIAAPVALVLYILPNTQKAYKIWYESFSKALLMFPIIAAFIAAGHVFALVAIQDQGNPINQIIGFMAYFAPYFLIPFTLKFAGGALGTIGGVVNDRGRGGFDRLRKNRQATTADRFKRAQSNSLWDNNSAIGRRANKVAGWAAAPLDNAAFAGKDLPGARLMGLKKRGYGIASSIEHAGVEQSGKLFEELNKMGYNDRAYRALSGQHNAFSDETKDRLDKANLLGKAPKSIAQIQEMSHIMSQSSHEGEQIAANAMEGSMGRLATLYQDPEMMKADIGAAGLMGLSAHGFATSADLALAGNDLAAAKGAGFAQSVVSQAQVLGVRSRPDIKAGYGITYEGGQFRDGMVSKEKGGGGRADALLDTLNSSDLAGAKGGAMKALEPTIRARIESPDSVKSRAQKDQLYQWAGRYSQASNDVKMQALNMIKEYGLEAEFNKVNDPTAGMTPAQIAALQAAGIDPNQFQQGGQGGPGGGRA